MLKPIELITGSWRRVKIYSLLPVLLILAGFDFYNAAARMNGLSYSKMMHGLKVANIDINRKMLAEMAVNDAAGFTALAEIAKKAIA